ncbi:hypothetical protein LNN31_03030 [Acetobacterium wieringae]|uniref:Uncharacterized protein n=1 Tax=Acetobacterium wieringae TaxID=52694 RepID=A0ABY6HIP4_9FIRM|nr:hypothetical protein [Acetobacterium wieringae]UYO63433.1 hypothetical protein LNN31_03030 [Acetobacterium wieringae]VUZ23458.1 Uncharacterised protein [Acetobacterium wieringae]
MKELMKSIESAIVAAELRVIGARECDTETEMYQNLEFAQDSLQEALCNFAKLCNMVEVK